MLTLFHLGNGVGVSWRLATLCGSRGLEEADLQNLALKDGAQLI